MKLIANWKMELSYHQSLHFFDDNINELHKMLSQNNSELIFCPSFEALEGVQKSIHEYQPIISLGAQDCSAHNPGPYTGQVSAQSLFEVGAAYCIIGHSETRDDYHLSNKNIFMKTEQLLKNNITPIICIGETQNEKNLGKTEEILRKQIALCDALNREIVDCSKKEIYLAYEPLWAVGSNNIPKENVLIPIFDWLKKQVPENYSFLYGGNVNTETLPHLTNLLEKINGLLIGRASCNIQSLKNMINLIK